MNENLITFTPAQFAELMANLKTTKEPLKGDTMLYRHYLMSWYKSHAEWAEKTKETYLGLIEKHILPCLGDTCLSHITCESLEDFIADKSQTLSPATLEKMQSCILKASLKEAKKRKYIEDNPAEYLRSLKVRNKTKRALSDTELESLIDVSRSHRLGFTVPLLLGTGMRKAELLGLTWDDVNFDTCTIRIDKDYVATSHACVLRETKTDGSERVASFPAYLLDTLRQIKERDNHSFVVSQAKQDKRVDPHNYSRLFRSWCSKAELKEVSAHSMRTMYCTIAHELGVDDETIIKQVGHTSTRMLTKHYLKQRSNKQQKEAASLMSNFLSQLKA